MITQGSPSGTPGAYVAFSGLNRSLFNELMALSRAAGINPQCLSSVEEFQAANPSARIVEIEIEVFRNTNSGEEPHRD